MRKSFLAVVLLVPASVVQAGPILIDAFDVGFGPESLGSETAGILDGNGQAGVQFPVVRPGIFGGERDSQFYVGFGDPGDTWQFGVDPSRGLFWDSDPTIHVNMNLDWDGSGDGSTFGGLAGVPTTPYSADFSAYDGVNLLFGENSAELQVALGIGNRDETTSPCGAACGFVSGFSTSFFTPTLVSGGQHDEFSVFLPFAGLSDIAAPFIPGADLTDVNFINLSIFSAPGVTGNDFTLRSVSVVPVPVPATALLFAFGGLGLLTKRLRS